MSDDIGRIGALLAQVHNLEDDLREREIKIKGLQAELTEARDLVDRMREHVEDADNNIDNWISVFDMAQDDDGVWKFDRGQSEIWDKHVDLLDAHNKLVRKWNKYVGQFNAKVAPKDIGRPLAASEAQKADVLKRRKAGQSIRVIAKETALGLRTVRTIIEKQAGTDRASVRAKELRRLEFDRQRATAFRARNSRREEISKQVTALHKAGVALIKRAKGLGR